MAPGAAAGYAPALCASPMRKHCAPGSSSRIYLQGRGALRAPLLNGGRRLVDVQTLTSSSTIFVAANFSAGSLNCVDSSSTSHFRDSQFWRNNAKLPCNITRQFSRAGDLQIASDLTKTGSRIFTRRSGTQTAKSQNASTRRLGPGFEPLAPPSAGDWLPGAVLGSLSVDWGLAPPGIGFGHLGLDVSVLEVLGLSWVSWRCISVPRAWIRAC